MRRLLALSVALSLAAGCATAPSEIDPEEIDPRQYAAYNCAELSEMATATDEELQAYVDSQQRTRVADALTWPLPTSRIIGTNRRNVREIARLSGERKAIYAARAEKRCTYE